MRFVSLVMLSTLTGCGGTRAASGGSGAPAQAPADYPPGPYGYTQGSVIEYIAFSGKRDPGGASGMATYSTLPMTPISFADYHDDASTRFLWLQGVGGWCSPCNAEQASVPSLQAMYEPRGVQILEVMIQGFTLGGTATEADLNQWASTHQLHVAVALDPDGQLQQFADTSALPLNMIIRTSDMTIQFMAVGQQDMASILGSVTK